ncbi:MAG: SRPBCC family protein [Candidatus Limnocylindrales bacterium]
MTEKIANRMALTLPSDKEIAVTRTFDAPRSLVFEAMIKCEHLSKWWGPRGYELAECSIDLRPGGAYRLVQRSPDGGVHPFKGVWREIAAPERLVFTQIYDVEPFSIHESVVTNVLTEHDGRTTLSQLIVFNSTEARDGMVASGMEWGATQSFERLDELLAGVSAA